MRNVSIALALAVASLFATACIAEDDPALTEEVDELSIASQDSELAALDAHEVRLSSLYGGYLSMTTNLGTTTCHSTCTYDIAAGTSVSVRPDTTFDQTSCMRFVGWSGTCTGIGEICSFVVDGPERATARWARATTRPNGTPCVPM